MEIYYCVAKKKPNQAWENENASNHEWLLVCGLSLDHPYVP